MLEVVRYATKLEEKVQELEREIRKMHFTSEYYSISQQKRDEMISTLMEENQKIKELNILYERIVHDQKRQINRMLQQKMMGNLAAGDLGSSKTLAVEMGITQPSSKQLVDVKMKRAGSLGPPSPKAARYVNHQASMQVSPSSRQAGQQAVRPSFSLSNQLESQKTRKLHEYHKGHDFNQVMAISGHTGPRRVVVKGGDERQNNSMLKISKLMTLLR